MNPEKSRERFRNLTLLSASERNYPASPAEAHLEAFDNVYANTFHEESVNTILDAVVNACSPRRAEVIGRFRPRGGIAINVKATYGEKIDE